MIVAALQFTPKLFDVDANLERIEELVRSSGKTFDLIVSPELATTGYCLETRARVEELSETINGKTAKLFTAKAKEWNAAIVCGFIERDGDRCYNASMLVTSRGVVGTYRKVHLFYKEKEIFDEGDKGFPVFDVGGVKIGMMICYDWRFPEASRSLALQGADIIAHPSDLITRRDVSKIIMHTRAIENKVICITSNRNGSEKWGEEELNFTGESEIINYNGEVLSTCDGRFEGVITADVDPIETRRKAFNALNDIFGDRRLKQYFAA